MNKKLRYFLILLFTVVFFSTSVYSETINNNTYKNKGNAILVEIENLNIFNDGGHNKLPKRLIPVGNTVGIKISTDGILVLGTGYINTLEGTLVIPAEDKVKVGDIIFEVNGQKVQTKDQLAEITSKSENVDLVLSRNNQILNVRIKAEKSIIDEKYKVGLWVRDTTQGIGTITFINPDTMDYYALGHGIIDIDTKDLMKVKKGEVLTCNITSISKGEEGLPGEIVGEIKVGEQIGDVTMNSANGIKGQIIDISKLELVYKELPVCDKKDVKVGAAKILSSVDNGTVKEYKINILQVDTKSIGNKNMVIEIVDEDLLEKTSGIVQGMSGSPIIQDGKIVGAVTHVFVNNPKKGYGVFIENMIE